MKNLFFPMLMALLLLTACNSDQTKTDSTPTAPESTKETSAETSETVAETADEVEAPNPLASFPSIKADPGANKLSNQDVIGMVKSNYPDLSLTEGEQRFCEDNLLYKLEVATVYYYETQKKLRAFAILGNTLLNEESCEEKAEFVSHVAAGRCDAALLEFGADGWEVLDFEKEVSTGGGNGEWGVVGEPFRLGQDNPGIPILTGWMGMGETYETTHLVGVIKDKIQPVLKLDTHWDNAGAAMTDDDYKCNCVSYEFTPGYGYLFELKLEKRDCSEEKGVGCAGPVLVFQQQAPVNQKYKVPEGFALD